MERTEIKPGRSNLEVTMKIKLSVAAGDNSGEECTNPHDGAVRVWVSAGDFLMGSTVDDTIADDDERSQLRVYLDG